MTDSLLELAVRIKNVSVVETFKNIFDVYNQHV